MAKNVSNTIIHGVSGKFGDQIVFRQKNGKTLLCKAPRGRRETSPVQQANEERFKKASQYAQKALEDPVLNATYTAEAKKKKGVSAYNVALSDYYNPPTIDEVDVSTYTGKTGESIKIITLDDYKVKSVTVHIHTGDSSLVEEGSATLKGTEWIYTTQTNSANLSGTIISVKVTDVPGNVTEKLVEV